MGDIHICFATNEQYAPYCGVAIGSAIKNKSTNDRLHVYVLNQRLSNDSKHKLLALSCTECEVQIVDVSPDVLKDAPLTDGMHLTVETYFRLLIPGIFNNLDRILYLDSDILVRGSLAEVFFMDLQGCLIAMSRGRWLKEKYEGHFNAGVLLIDCKQWRNEQISALMIEFMKINRDKIHNQDEELINLTLYGRIYELEYKWNRQIFLDDPDGTETMEDDIVLHFLSYAKPWHGVYQNALVEEYFHYLRRLPWKIEDKRERYKDIDPARYYIGLQSLLYLTAKGMISVENELLLLPAPDFSEELMYAALDLGFNEVRNVNLQNIPVCTPGNTRIIVESEFDYETKTVIEHLGYENGLNYSFLRKPFITDKLEKILFNIDGLYQPNAGVKLAIIIYGTANWATKCTEVLLRIGVNIRCYVDSSPEKWGKMLYGKEVISPGYLRRLVHENILIVIASSAFEEIRDMLIRYGMDQEKIVVFDFMRIAK